jgi:hypothetical protein
MRRLRTLLTGAACALLFSCGMPTGTCACPPARTHGVIYGSVHSPAGEPLAGAQVQATVFHSVCGEGMSGLDPAANRVTSDAAGAFRLRFYSVRGAEAVCVRVTARSTIAEDSSVAHVALMTRDERVTPDSVRVELVLP